MTRPRRQPEEADEVAQLRADVDEIAAELALRRNLVALPWCVRVKRPGIPTQRRPVERPADS